MYFLDIPVAILVSCVYLCSVLSIDGTNVETCVVCICNDTTSTVNCSHTNLTYVPPNPRPGRTLILNMSSVGLKCIYNTNFSTYGELQVLDLFNTSLTNIETAAFSNLTSLKYLNLSNNERLPMTHNKVNQTLFRNLTSLVELRIYGNTGAYHQDDYPDKALSMMKNLAELWIDGLTNKAFGPAFQTMTSLKTIRIPGDIIRPPWRFCDTNITDGMLDNLIHVTNFTMRKCRVKYVGKNAFVNMTKLYHLDLSYNRLLTIKGLSIAFPGMGKTNLAVLVINSIQNVPHMYCGVTLTDALTKSIGEIKTLKEIHVEYNAINGFGRKSMQYLPRSLEYINARRNEFEIGFYAFEAYRLENLTWFDMSFNFFPDENQIWHQGLPKPHINLESQSKPTVAMSTNLVTSEEKLPSASQGTDVKVTSTKETGYTYKTSSIVDFIQSKSFPSSKMNILTFTEFMHSNIQRRNLKTPVGSHQDDERTVCPETLASIPPGTIRGNLPKNLEYFDFSHSKLATPIPELYFNETNKLKVLNVSSSLLYCWDGPIHGFVRLEYLDLSFNLCSKMRKSFFDKVPTLKYLSIARNFLYDPIENDTNGRILRNLTNLEYLDMSNNRLLVVPERFLIRQKVLEVLNISENMLSSFDIDVRHMTKLNTIDLRENGIHTFPTAVRENLTTISERNYQKTRKTLVIYLHDNDIQCYCNNLDFLEWVYDHMSSCRFLDITISKCTYYNMTTIEIYNRKHFEAVLSHLKQHCTSYTGLIIGVAVALCVVLNIMVAYLVHRFRWKIRYWYYVVSSKPTTRSGYISIDSLGAIGSRFKYDVYIASSPAPTDRDFVLHKMKSRLENEKIRLFIQDDDIVPGQNIYSMIANAIHVSRAVILIISEGCEKENEWMIALRMAHEESLNRGQPIFSGIFLDHEPATPYSPDIREIRKRSYMDYPGEMQPVNEQTFWMELIEKITEAGAAQLLSLDT
nr:Toll-like receptor [Ruditapes philippinarum]